MKPKPKHIILLLMLMLTIGMKAQNIVGVVIDADDGYPVPSATVQYKGHNQVAVTNIDGIFKIPRRDGDRKSVV